MITFEYTEELVNEFIDSTYHDGKENIIDNIFADTSLNLKEFLFHQALSLVDFEYYKLTEYTITQNTFIKIFNGIHMPRVHWYFNTKSEKELIIIVNRTLKYHLELIENIWMLNNLINNTSEQFTIGRMDELFREFLMSGITNK